VLDPEANGLQLITLESAVSYLNADYEPAALSVTPFGRIQEASLYTKFDYFIQDLDNLFGNHPR
jgi:hypothetical protein